MVPLLELQRRQQMARLYFLSKGPSLLKCSIVAPEPPVCFIAVWQYTQVLSLARISSSSCLEIPYMLDMEERPPADSSLHGSSRYFNRILQWKRRATRALNRSQAMLH